jgi:hypothetical protein
VSGTPSSDPNAATATAGNAPAAPGGTSAPAQSSISAGSNVWERAKALANVPHAPNCPNTSGVAEDWNFTRADYARLTSCGQRLTMASDSSWLPAQLQQNLLNALDFVFGPTISPPATDGVNATDFFHGHLVIKKDPATASQMNAAIARASKVVAISSRDASAALTTARTAALGKKVRFENQSPTNPNDFTSGYPFVTDAKSSDVQKVAAYKTVVENVEPSLGQVMSDAAKIPGAAVMYHTFEFHRPADAPTLDSNSPRRCYVTPLDTNTPAPYTLPPGLKGYEGTHGDFEIVADISFLVDKTGAVHVRPFDPTSQFTSLELSTITGSPFAKSPGFER